MLHLRLSANEHESEPIGRRLEGIDGVSRMLSARSPGKPVVVLSADVEPGSAVAPITARRLRLAAPAGFAWLEVLGEARANSRPLARYLVMMAVAGIIAALGVTQSNAILIVGAMAVSPDLLPVCALCVGLVGRRSQLIRSSAATLTIGLALIAAVAAAQTFLLSVTGLLSDGFNVTESSISPFASSTDYSTVLVALAAGVAAMLSFETRASAAVGVAISVTTIPASAYLGVALGSGEISEGIGALEVLAINVALLIVSGTVTLGAQRGAASRSSQPT